MKALDLFCGGGGAAIGLHQAGFETIVGIDIEPHPNYPFDFIQADVLNLPLDIMPFDFIWASPPCQRFSVSSKFHGNNWKKHPDLLSPCREIIKAHPFWVIENVIGAPLRPDVVLTGPSVGLDRIVRKRYFECSFFMLYPPPVGLDSWKWKKGVAGTITTSMCCPSHFYNRKANGLPGRIGNAESKEMMGIPFEYKMTQKEVGESVPPPYSRYIATEAIRQINQRCT